MGNAGIRVWVCVLVAGFLCGCAWKGQGGVDGVDGKGWGNGSGESAWELVPVTMRVYPSTRFVRAEGASVLNARIELLDEMGDSVKGVGRFRMELYADDQEGSEGGGMKLYSWQVPMMSLEDQKVHYDSITRAYLFRLKLEDERTSRRDSVLEVIFTPVEGTRLTTRSGLPGGVVGE